MNLQEFSGEHGRIEAIFRRHHEYRKPKGNSPEAMAQIYIRQVSTHLCYLTPVGIKAAFKQGEVLCAMGIIPKTMFCGIDLRNWQGAKITADAIFENSNQRPDVLSLPVMTYPVYRRADQTAQAIEKFGDFMVHRYLNSFNRDLLSDLWTETAEMFVARISMAIEQILSFPSPYDSPVLFDLNYETLVVLFYKLYVLAELRDIPDEGGWEAENGGGIVYAKDKTIAVFDSGLNIIDCSAHKEKTWQYKGETNWMVQSHDKESREI